jgi:nitrogen fixation protein NifU and related proteins
MFSDAVIDHFQHPRNAGELADANVTVQVSNPVCGDVLQLAAIVEDGRICQLRFLCRGCTASIACASWLTESIQGKELGTIGYITPDFLAATLGGLPPASSHAAHLACDALQALLGQAKAKK